MATFDPNAGESWMEEGTPVQAEASTPSQELDLNQVAAGAVEDPSNFFQQATDFASEALGLRSQEESQEQRAEGIAQTEATEDQLAADDSFGAEVAKGVFGAPKNLATKVAGAAEFWW